MGNPTENKTLLLETRGLCKNFGGLKAISDLEAEVHHLRNLPLASGDPLASGAPLAPEDPLAIGELKGEFEYVEDSAAKGN